MKYLYAYVYSVSKVGLERIYPSASDRPSFFVWRGSPASRAASQRNMAMGGESLHTFSTGLPRATDRKLGGGVGEWGETNEASLLLICK